LEYNLCKISTISYERGIIVTRTQALTIGVLIGFVILAFMGVFILLRIPYERFMPPTPTLTPIPLPPTFTPTPTPFNLLPTAQPASPTPAEPTPTNTLVPTATPRPPRTPTPTVELKLPTRKPPDTPTPLPTVEPSPTNTVTTIPPTPIPRQYSIYLDADDNTITKGECTDLEWRVSGAAAIWLDGRSVAPTGREEVCPKRDTTYQLTIQLPGSAELISKTEEIRVEDE
jgi:hypothetical protein